MKKEIEKNKLSLTKMNITKLTNPHMVWGGTGETDVSDDPDIQQQQGKKLKCINNSKIVIEEKE